MIIQGSAPGQQEVGMTTMVARTIRPTQAERTAISRDKVIRAAISCLATHGHAATSITLIASTAKVSIGRMQHQFATKADIMAAVIDFIHVRNKRTLATRKSKGKEPKVRLSEFVRGLGCLVDEDTTGASIEIRMAMKGDKELAAAVEPRFRQYDAQSFEELEELLTACGVSRDAAHIWMRLIISAMRGMAMERVAKYHLKDRVEVPTSLNMLIDLLVPGHPGGDPDPTT